jgi:Tfp pilus assembly protein PilF
MSLVMTHVSARRIFQSGDFRLTDAETGKLVDAWAQKEIVVQRLGWTALVGFCGVATTGSRPVPDWIAARLRELPHDASFEEFIKALSWAERWLKNIPARFRALTFSVGAFVALKPTFVLISNFEALGRPPRRMPRELPAKLEVTRYRPTKDQLFLSGRPDAVTPRERLLLLGTFRKKPLPEHGYAALAKINRRAATRDGTIGAPCFTAHVTVLGESGGLVHDWPADLEYIPEFADVHGWFVPRIRRGTDEHGRPTPIQLKSMAGVMSVDSDEYFRIALEEKPDDPTVLSNFGNWLMKKGETAEADQALRRAIALNDTFASAHGNLGVLLEGPLNDPDSAEPEYRRALELEPESAIHNVNLAGFLWKRRGEIDAADELLRRALEIQRDAFTLGRRALFLHEALHDPEAATELYEEALAIAPNDSWVNANYGSLLWQTQGDAETARRHFERATANEYVTPDILCLRAGFEIEAGSIPEALKLHELALRKQPRDANTIAYLAATRSLAGADEQLVERGYRAALELDPRQPVAALNLAQLLLLRGDEALRDEAKQLLATVTTHPGTANEHQLEALFYGFAHQLQGYEQAPDEIHRLVGCGVRISHWDFQRDVTTARVRQHPQADVVTELAKRISS